MKKISLKKDEQTKVLVKYDNFTRIFKMRWTLYVNGALVLFRSYGNEVAQNTLYLNHTNQSFRVPLKPKGTDMHSVAYLLVRFKDFDYKNNRAIFEIFLSDEKSQIQMEYLKND